MMHRQRMLLTCRVAALLRVLAPVLLGALLHGHAVAQALRDPTLPPASAVAPAPVPVAQGRSAEDSSPMSVIVRDGRRHLVVGTRLVAEGGMLGSARIERITETEIWLREQGQLRKLPRFAGVRVQPHVQNTAPCAPSPRAAASASARRTATPPAKKAPDDCARVPS